MFVSPQSDLISLSVVFRANENGKRSFLFSLKFILFFKSRSRYEVYMDENGDAEGNYTLVSRRRHPDAGKGYGLFPAGRFAKLRNLTTKNPVCSRQTITAAATGEHVGFKRSLPKTVVNVCPTKWNVSFRRQSACGLIKRVKRIFSRYNIVVCSCRYRGLFDSTFAHSFRNRPD